jgi:hypothetical protein
MYAYEDDVTWDKRSNAGFKEAKEQDNRLVFSFNRAVLTP